MGEEPLPLVGREDLRLRLVDVEVGGVGGPVQAVEPASRRAEWMEYI